MKIQEFIETDSVHTCDSLIQVCEAHGLEYEICDYDDYNFFFEITRQGERHYFEGRNANRLVYKGAITKITYEAKN